MNVLLRATALWALFAIAGCDQRPDDWLAEVQAFRGEAQRLRGTTIAPVKQPMFFRLGDRLQTGPRSQLELRLRNGGSLTVKPDTMIVFAARPTSEGLSLRLERGVVIGTAAKLEAATLLIGVGRRKIALASAARAEVSSANGRPGLVVEFGQATVSGPTGQREIVVAGKPLSFAPRRPDAAVDAVVEAAGDADVAHSEDAAQPASERRSLAVEVLGGRVLVQSPDRQRFVRLRGRRPSRLLSQSTLRLRPGSTVRLRGSTGAPLFLRGPATFVVGEKKDATGRRVLAIERIEGTLISHVRGRPGQVLSPVLIESVLITPRIRHRESELAIERAAGKVSLELRRGAAELREASGRRLPIEAAQRAELSAGRVSGPRSLPPGPLRIEADGGRRLFSGSARVPLTLRWLRPAGVGEVLVEVSPRSSMAEAIFADRLQRQELTLGVGRGRYFYRVRPVMADGSLAKPLLSGHLRVLPDTSHRALANLARPRNTLRASDRNTEVYYQNRLPHFTFSWSPIPRATRYRLKLFGEQHLRQPLVERLTRRTSLALRPGLLREGGYLWYVSGLAADGSLVRTTGERRLTIRYDNATPDLQIRRPREGQRVAAAMVEAAGVTIPGSKVYIDGKAVELDRSSRFRQPIALRRGRNIIVFRVVDKKRGSSYYLRTVIRR
ncbi:MAG: FecR domain-containing protein [Deltaproteobacteria bacterium]|nr:FecR domain-containing protein [Deltaproteobacteria bacterium]